MKILINLQVGSVREKILATPFSRVSWRNFYLETIEGSLPVFSGRLLRSVATKGCFRPELTFSLVLTARILAYWKAQGKGFLQKTRDVDGGEPLVFELPDSEALEGGTGEVSGPVARPCLICLCKKGAPI
ncbi:MULTISPECIES: hypothetical protein [Pseudomonas]|uniref:hypothetical protein n=1 Tax=Pseudomonas TaxID=286 RepID=UPI00128F1E1E|nr:hypothetical protein [Pseudomonas fuscovaginae]